MPASKKPAEASRPIAGAARSASPLAIAAAAVHAPLGAGGMLALQHAVGNRAVVQMTRDAAKPRTKRTIAANRRKPGPKKAKWLRELEAQQAQEQADKERQAQAQRDRLSAQGTKDLLTDRIRGGVGGLQNQLGLGANLRDLYQQALPEAAHSYGEFASGHKHRLKFPLAPAIRDQPFLEHQASQLANDPSIESEDARTHLGEHERALPAALREYAEGRRAERPLTSKQFLEDQHRRARIKTAGVWSEHAAAYLSVAKGATKQQADDEDPQEGRDLTGRLGYLLMTTDAADLFSGLTGGTDPKEGVARKAGQTKLVLDLEDIFSSAACHKDADQVLHLMAGALIAKGVEQLTDARDEAALLGKITSAISGSKASVKVLKLTDKGTHSIAYLIGDHTTPLETIAGVNSDSILYNRLIHFKVREQQVQAALRDGFAKIAKTYTGRKSTLEWDLYEGTDLPQLTTRIDQHLSAGITALRAGLAIESVERRQDDRAVGPVRDEIVLPFSELNTQAHAQVFLMSKDQPISKRKLVNGTAYRVQYRGRWMKATYLGLDPQAPAWMKPAAHFKILEIRTSFKDPVSDERTVGLQKFATEVGWGGKLMQLMNTPNLTGQTIGGLYVVSDPGNAPNRLREIKVRKV